MQKRIYSKPALTYHQQLELLKERGLTIQNKDKALHLLEQVSYYRLSAYFYPLFVDKANHIFKKDARFQDAFYMYCFDRELRQLINGEIEKIEISVRAEMAYRLSHKYDAYWYTYPALFKDTAIHTKCLQSVKQMFEESNEEFVVKFKENYVNNNLPSWMAMEIITFGTLSMLYKNLSDYKCKIEIAKKYGLKEVIFESWLHVLVYIRNICAHHSRLWNREFSIVSTKVKSKPGYPWIETDGIARNRSYFNLSIIKYLINAINPTNTMRSRMFALQEKYPTIDFHAMGFPDDWIEQPVWKI